MGLVSPLHAPTLARTFIKSDFHSTQPSLCREYILLSSFVYYIYIIVTLAPRAYKYHIDNRVMSDGFFNTRALYPTCVYCIYTYITNQLLALCPPDSIVVNYPTYATTAARLCRRRRPACTDAARVR